MHKWLIPAFIIILLATSALPMQAYAILTDAGPETDAVSAVLAEANRGQILYEKNADQHLHISIASKIMTALLAVEKAELDSKITISREAANVKGSVIDLETGNKYDAKDLITAILLTQSNDAAIALAEYIAGDSEKFAGMMNEKAVTLNMKDTNFMNPTGLFDELQYTTARDLCILLQYALKNPDFNRLFSIKGQPFDSQILTNSNKMFWQYDGTDGGKSGYNEKDKPSAVTTATRNGQRIMAIVLDSSQESIWEDSIRLFDYGFNNFKTGILVSKNQVLKNIPVDGQEIGLISTQDVYYTYPVGDSYIKTVEFSIPKELKLPLLKINPVGSAIYILNDGTKIDVPLYPDKELAAPKTYLSQAIERFKQVKDLVYLIALLLIIEIAMVASKIYHHIKNKRPTGHS